jgi:cytosine/uracil/thiamine/allantoin permease
MSSNVGSPSRGSLANGHQHSYEQLPSTSKVTIVAAVAYVCGLLGVFILVNEEVPDPYMDEIFHVDQARSYCVGNFSYVSIHKRFCQKEMF